MINDVSPTTSGYFVTKAEAIIGRPATPMTRASRGEPRDGKPMAWAPTVVTEATGTAPGR
jgi:hypothetical protein